MRTIRVLVFLLMLAGLGAVAFIYSGIYDVSAMTPHTPATEWVLSTVMDRSVARHARGIKAPDLNGKPKIEAGLRDYQERCAVCHGAPGTPATDIAQGLNPPAPDLGASANELSAPELFWVAKNGIKMTGMPAFEVTRSDDQLWSVVAFLERLRTLSTEDYMAMSTNAAVSALKMRD